MMENLILIGYRGSGKSTIGEALANELCYDWSDSDLEMEVAYGKPISELWQYGEEEFRTLEALVIQDMVSSVNPSGRVLSLGGGSVMSHPIRGLCQKHTCVYLKASVETLHNRLKDDTTRPSLTTLSLMDEIEEVLKIRQSIYEGCADKIIEVGKKSVDQIVKEIQCFSKQLKR